MRLKIRVEAEHIDWKALIEKVNDAVDDETTDMLSTNILYSDSESED